MRGAPRAASASRSEAQLPQSPRTGTGGGGWIKGSGLGRTQRLRSPDQFAALAGDRAPWRQSLQWIAAAARIESAGPAAGPAADPDEAAGDPKCKRSIVRFGFTVGRRQARRAVQRNLIKRLMREAARSAGPALAQAARVRGVQVDVVMRLRSALPDPEKMTLATVKRAVRQEADALMARLGNHLNGGKR
jgi:ribonuclease P protein component